jgi:toxin secretion/phage lysis holin
MENMLKGIVGVGGAATSFLFGGWPLLMQVLMIFIMVDYALGVLVAATFGKLNSKIGFRGIAKKVIIVMLVAIAHSVDTILGDAHFVRDTVIFFYLANELISILETVGKTNLPVPDVLKRAVETLGSKGSEK